MNKSIHIFCCVNKKPVDNPGKSCGRQGSDNLIDALKAKLADAGAHDLKVTKTLCLGKCKKGPSAIIYPEGQYIRYSCDKDLERLVGYFLGKNDINSLII